MWDYQYERVSINLVAVWGDDVVDNLPFPTDDEKYLTLDLTKKLGRRKFLLTCITAPTKLLLIKSSRRGNRRPRRSSPLRFPCAD